MKISVLINNYNYGRFLRQCIDSALAQDWPDLEVVVVDDGSSDDSREIIASYAGRIVPVLKPNGGQASCFNEGFAAATGDVIFLLDADDAFLPGKLAAIADAYERFDIEWCFDHVTPQEGASIPAELDICEIDKRVSMRRGQFPSIPVPTSGLSFRRELLAQILPMPLASDVVLSDNYLKFAAALLGRGAVIETPLTFQRLHEANRYTSTARSSSLRPRIMVETGYRLASRYRDMSRLGLKLVAGGLAETNMPIASIAREIHRCTSDGTFGRLGAAEIAARLVIRRLSGGRPRRAAS